MTDVLEHSGTFRVGRPEVGHPYFSTDFRNEPPRDKPPLREESRRWMTHDNVVIELRTEYLYFPFERYEHYRRYTLTINGAVIQIDRVDNYYAFDGSIAPETVVYTTAEGELAVHHIRVRDFDNRETDKFTDTAHWCRNELTAAP